MIPEEREKILKDLYDDRKTGQGIGIRLFYNLVSGKYLNITRVDVQNFLRKQGDYSITRPYNKTKYNKPVLAKVDEYVIDLYFSICVIPHISCLHHLPYTKGKEIGCQGRRYLQVTIRMLFQKLSQFIDTMFWKSRGLLQE